MTRARRAAGAGPAICWAKVRVSDTDTHTRRQRLAQAARRGLAPEVCGRRAAWIVDGAPYCLVHGGVAALRILECVEA